MPTSARPCPSALPALSRNTTVVLSVIALHVAVLWAMQTGLLRRVAEAVVPAEILVEIMAPPAPEQKPQPMLQPKVQAKAPTPKPAQPTPAPAVAPQPAPAPLAIAPSATAPAPSAAAPTAAAAAPASANTGSTANAPPAPPAPPKVVQPSSDADYLDNPTPSRSTLSRRLGEQGTLVLRILVGTDGKAQKIELQKSSGFDRLDRSAMDTLRNWRYKPGTRGGVPEAMWVDIPVTFAEAK